MKKHHYKMDFFDYYTQKSESSCLYEKHKHTHYIEQDQQSADSLHNLAIIDW